MKTKYYSSFACATNSGATVYAGIQAPQGTDTLGANATMLIAAAGTFRKLRVRLNGTPDAGGSDGYTFTFQTATGTGAPADTALTTTILSGTPSYQNEDVTNEVAVAAGDAVRIACTLSGTPDAAPKFSVEVEFEGTDAAETAWMGRSPSGTNLHATDPFWTPACGQRGSATESAAIYVSPLAGTITGFFARLITAPGSGITRSAQITINGTPTGTVLSWANINGVQSSTSESIAINVGDTVAVKWTVSGGSAAGSQGYTGLVVEPTTAGQFAIPLAGQYNASSTSAARYVPLSWSPSGAPTATEANVQGILSNDITISALTVNHVTDPGGAGKTYTYSLRKDADNAPTTFAVQFGNGETGSKTTTGTYAPTKWSLYDTAITPANTPAGSVANMSYLASAAAPTGNPSALCLLGVG